MTRVPESVPTAHAARTRASRCPRPRERSCGSHARAREPCAVAALGDGSDVAEPIVPPEPDLWGDAMRAKLAEYRAEGVFEYVSPAEAAANLAACSSSSGSVDLLNRPGVHQSSSMPALAPHLSSVAVSGVSVTTHDDEGDGPVLEQNVESATACASAAVPQLIGSAAVSHGSDPLHHSAFSQFPLDTARALQNASVINAAEHAALDEQNKVLADQLMEDYYDMREPTAVTTGKYMYPPCDACNLPHSPGFICPQRVGMSPDAPPILRSCPEGLSRHQDSCNCDLKEYLAELESGDQISEIVPTPNGLRTLFSLLALTPLRFLGFQNLWSPAMPPQMAR